VSHFGAGATAVVTGAGSGLGRAVAHTLIRRGWTVVLAGRRPEALLETAAQAQDPQRTLPVSTDVTCPESVRALFEVVRTTYGRLDLLVNNAGVHGPWADIRRVSPQEWDTTLATNLTGAFLCAREAFDLMARQQPRGGRIINNGSASAQVPRPWSVAYTAAKHGMTGLTKALSLEGRRFGIACGQIDIGNAASGMTGEFSRGVIQADLTLREEPLIAAGLVADLIAGMADLPLDANVQACTVLATGMPFTGRG
jgi:NAD(P)-dependent dehydrogenase (short-subunit alcohol dehydrogenase family)